MFLFHIQNTGTVCGIKEMKFEANDYSCCLVGIKIAVICKGELMTPRDVSIYEHGILQIPCFNGWSA